MNRMYEHLDALESTISALSDAEDYMKAMGIDYASNVDCISEMRHDLEREADDLKAKIYAAEEAETAAMEREYYRAVI